MFKDYDCIIDYHLGKANVVADTLSIKEMTALLIQRSEWRIVSNGDILAQLKVQPVLKQMIMLRKMMKRCRKRYRWSEMVIRLIFQ